jgi:hypothetical protein
MTRKRKIWILAGIMTPPLVLILLTYRAHETRKAEVIANCRALLEKKTLEEKEATFLVKYGRVGTEHPWEGNSHVTIPPSRVRQIHIGNIAFKLHYWREVTMDDRIGLPGWNYASSGYDFCVFDWKKKNGCIIGMKYLLYAGIDDDCTVQITRTHAP